MNNKERDESEISKYRYQLKTEHFQKITMETFLKMLEHNFSGINESLQKDGFYPIDSIQLCFTYPLPNSELLELTGLIERRECQGRSEPEEIS